MKSLYTRPRDWVKKASGFDLEYSSNIQLKLKITLSFFIPMFRPKVCMNCYFYFISRPQCQPAPAFVHVSGLPPAIAKPHPRLPLLPSEILPLVY